jgi:hypothetical protein
MFIATDPPKKVVTFYKGQFKEKGWKMRIDSESPQGSLLQGEKEGRTLAVFINEKADGTSILLTLSKGK